MPVLLDLFCGAGGCSMGYRQAGWLVVGVDREPMPDYPFMHFVQADALEYVAEHGHKFDAIHASPPCQVHSVLSHLCDQTPGRHVDLVPQTRAALIATGKPYVIENVPGAPLIDPVILCGSMFGLQTSCGAQLRRHRLFETNWPLVLDMECRHGAESVSVTGPGNAVGGRRKRTITVTGHSEKSGPYNAQKVISVMGHSMEAKYIDYDGVSVRETYSTREAEIAMGIYWMSRDRLSQAIPPAYCKWIGERLMDYVKGGKANGEVSTS